jgi:hypothetical protein
VRDDWRSFDERVRQRKPRAMPFWYGHAKTVPDDQQEPSHDHPH